MRRVPAFHGASTGPSSQVQAFGRSSRATVNGANALAAHLAAGRGAVATLGDAAQAITIDLDALAGAVGVLGQLALAVVGKALVNVNQVIDGGHTVAGIEAVRHAHDRGIDASRVVGIPTQT